MPSMPVPKMTNTTCLTWAIVTGCCRMVFSGIAGLLAIRDEELAPARTARIGGAGLHRSRINIVDAEVEITARVPIHAGSIRRPVIDAPRSQPPPRSRAAIDDV